MELKKYLHLEKYGSDEIEGIDAGNEVYLFDKLDGTASSVSLQDGKIVCCSRNRVLSIDSDNQGFCNYIYTPEVHQKYMNLLTKYPNFILYGEWLVPHTIKYYTKYRENYIYDVYDEDQGRFLHYNEYSQILDQYNIEYIPCFCIVRNGNEDVYRREMIENAVFLLPEGHKREEQYAEGIVIKNYEFINKYGRICFAKMVRNSFKTAHSKAQTTTKQFKDTVEQRIAEKAISEHLVKKTIAKIEAETGSSFSNKHVLQLLGRVFHDVVTEELWDALKAVKGRRLPVVDFKRLQHCCYQRTKLFITT